jgi:hypothetical protein
MRSPGQLAASSKVMPSAIAAATSGVAAQVTFHFDI